MRISIPLLILALLLNSCNESDALPKPKGFLSLNYSVQDYKEIATNNYRFEVSNNTKPTISKDNWMRIKYPSLKASVNISYRPVKNNIQKLLAEAKKTTTVHQKKANAIYYDSYQNEDENVFGYISNVTGNVASPLQFIATDKKKHFISGSVYFNTEPNYDSIYPAIKYIEKDLLHLMESLKWKK